MKTDFVPSGEAEFRAWLVNVDLNIAVQGPILGMSAAQIVATKADIQSIITSIDNCSKQKDLAKSATAQKDAAKTLHLKNLRNQIALSKMSPAYTVAIGKLLGVEASAIVIDEVLLKPTISAITGVGGVIFKFDKKRTDGVNIYSRRGSETGFSFLARDSHSPYLDSRDSLTPGEERQYYAVFVKDDIEIGQASDIITIAI